MFYQQEDLKYPGKILAIIPISNKQKEMINNFFMQIKKRSYFCIIALIRKLLE